MKLNKWLLAGNLLSITLTACAPNANNISEVQPAGDGIVGGIDVKAGDKIHESVVAVYDTLEGQLCTGSLLPNNLVLTAAHCIGQDPEAMIIFFDTKITENSIARPVDKVQVSPYWETRQNLRKDTGDIALIHFLGSVPKGYKPATFINMNQRLLQKGTPVVLAGFGISNGTTKEGAGSLRVTKVRIADPKFSNSEIKLDQTKGTGACHGDSGGPAYLEYNGRHYLWGVTSRGVQDENNDCTKYSAYTNALYYRVWIQKAASKLSASLVSPQLGK